jgi:radical SAM protein with 4Fe4S-binding SPASM domain
MECAETGFPSSVEFIRTFNRKSAELRIPISGSIDLTRRCNLSCIHCYAGGSSIGTTQREMETGKILSVIDEICEAGCLYLLITGGEPLLRKDFPEIYRYAKGKGLLITVFTNGTLITDEIIDLLKELPPRVVEISLYGATAATYEKITGVEGSYERCMHGISHLLSGKIHVSLKTILMTANSHEFFDIENIAKELGVKFRFDAEIFPRLDGDKSPLNLRVPALDAAEKEFSDNERLMRWEKYFERTNGQSLPDTLYNCGAGVTSFHIDPYGNLQPCLMVTNIRYNLLTGSFMSGWNNVISSIINKGPGKAIDCNRCEKRHLCSFCPAFFELENGSGDLPSEYICSMGNHRFQRVTNMHFEGDRHAAQKR